MTPVVPPLFSSAVHIKSKQLTFIISSRPALQTHVSAGVTDFSQLRFRERFVLRKITANISGIWKLYVILLFVF